MSEAQDQTVAPASPSSRASVPLIALAVALVAALVVLGLTWKAWQDARDDLATETAYADRARSAEVLAEDAEEAAVEATEHMTSYDYRSLEQDFAWVEEDGTEKFRETFTTASQPIRKAITRLQAHADGVVVASSATLVDAAHATVLLFVDQSISDSTGAQPTEDRSRVEMKMVLEGDRWLVDEVILY